MSNNLSKCTVSCLSRPIETKSTLDICLLPWLQPILMVFSFLNWLCPVVQYFMISAETITFVIVLQLLTIYCWLWFGGVAEYVSPLETFGWWKSSLSIYHTTMLVLVLGGLDPDTFQSVSSLKMLPSWTPAFLILYTHSPRLGQVPAGCDRNRPDVCI